MFDFCKTLIPRIICQFDNKTPMLAQKRAHKIFPRHKNVKDVVDLKQDTSICKLNDVSKESICELCGDMMFESTPSQLTTSL